MMRIISVVPSQTELLYHLGADPIAQTIFCIHPENRFKKSVKIGGTKKLNLAKIRSLQPDLIIANREENERSQIEALQSEFKVWVSDIHDFEDALKMIVEVGQLTNTADKAIMLSNQIRKEFHELSSSPIIKKPRVLYLIWKNPYMAAAHDTFINSMLQQVGFENALPPDWVRYPEIDLNQMRKLNPDYIFLSSEPFPFKQQHVEDISAQIPGCKVLKVDGEMFSWYGNRMLLAADYFQRLKEEIGMI
jgi:ABC-type Fe3+-hydroxamate transport system substrate-binding protein